MNEARRSEDLASRRRPSKTLAWAKGVLGVCVLLAILAGLFVLSPYGKRFSVTRYLGIVSENQARKVLSLPAPLQTVTRYLGVDSESQEVSPEAPKMTPSEAPQPSSRAPLQLSATQQQLLGVETARVEVRPLEKVIRTVGRVEYDERKLADHSLKVGGWIGKLYVNFTGQLVKKGQPLFTFYSPELLTAQQEYLLALETREKVARSPLPDARKDATALVEASQTRLRLWDLSAAQIEELAKSGKAQEYVPIYSSLDGFVIESKAVEGMFVRPGMSMFKVADLSTIWILADIYEYEMPFIKVGQEARVTLAYAPGRTLKGTLTYIYPTLDTETRTVRVRLEFPNRDLALKPGMYGNVEIRVVMGKRMAVPESAVLDSGVRALVFVSKGNGGFEPREVELGAKVDRHYVVLKGLAPGDRVVTSANFLLDSESQLMAATGGMKGMMSMIGMGDAPMGGAAMSGMAGMEGMEGMEGMKGGMQGMEGMKGMEGMEGMEMEGMEEVKEPAPMKEMRR